MIHPTNETSPGVCETEGLPNHTNGANFSTDRAINQAAPDGKTIATELAHLALAGHVVHKGGAKHYSICIDFADLEIFARRLGVKQ